jgi:hypothetical protein
MTKNKQSRSTTIPVRVEPELRVAIEAAAEQDRRPMANLIRNILADWVNSRSSHGEHAATQTAAPRRFNRGNTPCPTSPFRQKNCRT